MKGFSFCIRFPLHWGEMDALGHVNNTRYFVWFESARIAYVDAIGFGGAHPRAIGPILAHARCDFLRPIVYPAEIVVGCRVAKVGTTSVTMEYAAARADAEDGPCARGESVIVIVEYASGAKVPIDDALRARLLRGP